MKNIKENIIKSKNIDEEKLKKIVKINTMSLELEYNETKLQKDEYNTIIKKK